MAIDLDKLVVVLQEHLGDLIAESKRLHEENTFLLEENRRLRDELTVQQLRSDIDRMDEIDEIEAQELIGTLPDDARDFFRKLPERLTFAEYFRIADTEGLSDERARSYLTVYLRENVLQQHGRRIQKQRINRTVQLTT